MAMRRTATGALVRRPVVASVAYTLGLRFVASLSPEDQKKMETGVEAKVWASMEPNFDVRVRDIVKTEMREIIKSEAANIKSGLNIELLLENATSKQALAFQEEMSQQKLHFEEKLKALLERHGGAVADMKILLNKQKDQCSRRAEAADNKLDLLSQIHADFEKSSNEFVQKTQFQLPKVAACVLGFIIIGGMCYVIFH